MPVGADVGQPFRTHVRMLEASGRRGCRLPGGSVFSGRASTATTTKMIGTTRCFALTWPSSKLTKIATQNSAVVMSAGRCQRPNRPRDRWRAIASSCVRSPRPSRALRIRLLRSWSDSLALTGRLSHVLCRTRRPSVDGDQRLQSPDAMATDGPGQVLAGDLARVRPRPSSRRSRDRCRGSVRKPILVRRVRSLARQFLRHAWPLAKGSSASTQQQIDLPPDRRSPRLSEQVASHDWNTRAMARDARPRPSRARPTRRDYIHVLVSPVWLIATLAVLASAAAAIWFVLTVILGWRTEWSGFYGGCAAGIGANLYMAAERHAERRASRERLGDHSPSGGT